LERELQKLLRDTSTTVLTTMFDYYAFPADAPGLAGRPRGSPDDRVRRASAKICCKPAETCFNFAENYAVHFATKPHMLTTQSANHVTWSSVTRG
jgi:hypothetical protein